MTRDCEHGRQIGKCADCEVIRLEALNAELLEALGRITNLSMSQFFNIQDLAIEAQEIATDAIARAEGEQK